ncbi:TRAP transporter small permease [Fodinicurvata sp. EGI_FJ10296]|uniref:TRAP transporter small permease n=1 Tax=Fodinicurvata sp. EGI_FJ10296 TaxID=3231908 RepID=UPI003454CB90
MNDRAIVGAIDFFLRPLQTVGQLIQKVEVAVISLAAGLLVVATGWGVFSRYILDQPLPWPPEFGVYIYVWMSYIGAAVVLRRRKHISISFFVDAMPFVARTLVNIVVHLLGLFFFVIVIQYSWRIMGPQLTLEFGAALRWPKAYLTASLFLAACSMALSSVQIILEDFRSILRPPADPDALEPEAVVKGL